MEMSRIVGITVLAVGLALLAMAYNATSAPIEELSNTLTGRHTNETIWYFAAGMAGALGGGLIIVFGSRK